MRVKIPQIGSLHAMNFNLQPSFLLANYATCRNWIKTMNKIIRSSLAFQGEGSETNYIMQARLVSVLQ